MTSSSFGHELELFVGERSRLDYSRTYLQSLKNVLLALESSMLARGRPAHVAAVTEADLLASLESERARGLRDSTLHVHATAYRIFFGWLYKRGRILVDPARSFTGPPQQRRLGYVPTPADVRRLLDVCDVETDRGLKNRAILELLYGSGLRINEVRSLDVKDVDLAERTAFIKNAKGRKDRIVPITEAAARMIVLYLERVRPSWPHPALFVTTHGGRFEPTNWRRRQLRPLLMDLGLPLTLTPHRLRHACAVHLLQNGADVRHIQKLLGHASINSTEIYLSLDACSLKRTIDKAHPREREARGDDVGEVDDVGDEHEK